MEAVSYTTMIIYEVITICDPARQTSSGMAVMAVVMT